MSEQKKIKLKFEDKEIEVGAFATFQEVVDFFQKNFAIDEEKKKNLSLYYFDEDGDQISFQGEKDYKIFIEEEGQIEKVIEGEIGEKPSEEISLEQPNPLKSATIFNKKVPEQGIDLSIKNVDSSYLANSLYSIESLNNAMTFPKKNIKNDEEFLKEINQMQNMVEKTLEEKNKEDEIEKVKKELEEEKKKHEEELKRKEEENQKKYKEALAKKENELKQQLEEMKSKIELKEKEFFNMQSKIEIDNKKKIEEFQKKEIENQKKMEELEENLKKLEEVKKKETENIKNWKKRN